MNESYTWYLSLFAVLAMVLVAAFYASRNRNKLTSAGHGRSIRTTNKCWCCYSRALNGNVTGSNKRTVSKQLVKAFSCHSNSIESHSENDDDDDDSAALLLGYERDKNSLHRMEMSHGVGGSSLNRMVGTSSPGDTIVTTPPSRLIPIEHVKNVIFNQNNLNYNGNLTTLNSNGNGFHSLNSSTNMLDIHHLNGDNNNLNGDANNIIYENVPNIHFQAHNYYGNNLIMSPDQSRCNSRFSNDNCSRTMINPDLYEVKRRLFRRQTSLSTEDGSQESYSHSTDLNPAILNPSSRQSNGLKQRTIFGSVPNSYKCNSKSSYHQPNGLLSTSGAKLPSSALGPSPDNKTPIVDLISLAEKGRIGKQTSIEENSSEAGSNIEPILTNVFRKKLTNRMLLRMQTNNISSESSNSLKDDERPTRGKFERMQSFGSNECESDSISSTFNVPKPISQKISDLKAKPLSGGDKNSKMSFSGKLEIGYAYDAPSKKLHIGVLQLAGQNSTGKNRLCEVAQMHVQLTLLPSKRHKHKTKTKPIFGAIFMESFTFSRISNSEIAKSGVRFRVYCQSAFSKKNQLIGECELQFQKTRPQQQETRVWLELEPPKIIKRQISDDRSEVSSLGQTESTSSQSLNATLPEILLGLAYNATTGRLSVTIIKGSQLRTSGSNSNGGGSGSSKSIDTYVKVTLLSSNGQEIARSKTSVCRGQPNPYFKETFMFQVALFQLPDVTLMLLTYSRRNIKRKDLIGWISFGFNSSGDEQTSHWNDMRDNRGEQVLRWHILQQS